jgi:2-amino-4-hydroxy-6-hydroxymethyldihydropteridine diphosphokinase
MAMHLYAIALGSNRRHGRYGDPIRVLRAAIAALEAAGLAVREISPILRTAALGPAGRSFANAALIGESKLAPPDLLAMLKHIERDFGRRRGRRWGPRVLDLDILLWSGGKWRAPHLHIPHPQIAMRRFVLDPLVRIAPEWRLAGGSVRQLRARLTRLKPVHRA